MAATRKLESWDLRLIQGFTLPGVPEEVRAGFVTALGALGCEAEFGLNLLQTPLRQPRPTRAQGEQWLRQCYLLGVRLQRISGEFELATQSYLGAMALAAPLPAAMRPARNHLPDGWGERFDATPGVWWPVQGSIAIDREPIEFWLRRAGFAYRHCISIGLPSHIDALEEALSLVMHALRTLPPSGVVTREAIAISLLTLTTEMEGDLVPHHLHDLDARHIGLLNGIATLLRLTPAAGADLAADVAWARGELARARAIVMAEPATRGPVTRPLQSKSGDLWARQMLREWEETVAQLEHLRR